MSLKTYFVALIAVFSYQFSAAQVTDTIRVMHYNLLNYRNVTSFCTESNNNSDQKDQNLKTIIQYVKPDIFTVNEMGATWLNPPKILSNALNKDGIDYYDQAEFASNGSSSIANALFFNSNKLELHSQSDITKDKTGYRLIRSIDIYKLYYKDEVALQKGDTNFIVVFVCHLKAGSTSTDKSTRDKETTALMDYLNDNQERGANYILCGDFNIQSASEDSYEELVNHTNGNIRFVDPIDAAGTWNNKDIYANLHTQSTRSSSNGCASGGGMDDRFDFILCGNEVMQGDYDLKYIDKTYKAVGQDSRRFNGTINSPENKAVPKAIADALFNTSDHLPVIMDMSIKTQKVSAKKVSQLRWSVVSPTSDQLHIESQSPISAVQLYSLDGRLIFNKLTEAQYEIHTDLPKLPNGIYTLKVSTTERQTAVKKIVILNQ